MSKSVVIIGSGGHSKVIADIIEKSNDIVYGFLDDNCEVKPYKKYKYLGKVENCLKFQEENQDLYFIIAIGNNYTRQKIGSKYNLNYYTAIHPNSNISTSSIIGKGTVVMAGTCINSDVKIGKHCIINTGTVIEHDNIIEDYVHISPNSTLCGTVKIGKLSHIGASSTIINNLEITERCIIGAGAVVTKNILEEGTYVGIPAKKIK